MCAEEEQVAVICSRALHRAVMAQQVLNQSAVQAAAAAVASHRDLWCSSSNCQHRVVHQAAHSRIAAGTSQGAAHARCAHGCGVHGTAGAEQATCRQKGQGLSALIHMKLHQPLQTCNAQQETNRPPACSREAGLSAHEKFSPSPATDLHHCCTHCAARAQPAVCRQEGQGLTAPCQGSWGAHPRELCSVGPACCLKVHDACQHLAMKVHDACRYLAAG